MLIATSCRKKEEEPVIEEKQIIEVEKKEEKPVEESYRVKPMSFISKVVLDEINSNQVNEKTSDGKKLVMDINTDKNFQDIENADFDIAIIPAYLGPYLYNRTNKDIKIAAITQTGNIHLVSDTALNSQRDYRNKNFFVPDPAGNLAKIIDDKIGPLNMLLRLNLEYYRSMDEILKKMDHTENYVSILTEPYYTKALRTTHYVSDVADLLPIGEGEFITEIIIVNKDYLDKNKDIVDRFLDDYQKVSKEISKDTSINKDLLNWYDLTADEAKLAIERSEITFIDGNQMKDSYETFIDRLEEVDKNIFDGERPDDDFYYID